MTTICDCELSQNGIGLVGRECDCPPGMRAEIERLRAENRILAKAIVYGDEAFSDSAEWEAILQVAETINSQT